MSAAGWDGFPPRKFLERHVKPDREAPVKCRAAPRVSRGRGCGMPAAAYLTSPIVRAVTEPVAWSATSRISRLFGTAMMTPPSFGMDGIVAL